MCSTLGSVVYHVNHRGHLLKVPMKQNELAPFGLLLFGQVVITKIDRSGPNLARP
jgi:hypothetical protein